MLVLMLCLAMNGLPENIVHVKTYAQSEDEELLEPFAMCFGEKGELIIFDRKDLKIKIWDEHGKFLRSFGETGEGPASIEQGYNVATYGGEIWVYDFARLKLIRFSMEGKFLGQKRQQMQTIAFGVLPNEVTLIGGTDNAQDGKMLNNFSLFDKDGKKVFEELYSSPAIISMDPFKLMAFAPQPEVQRYKDTWVYGSSVNQQLTILDKSGEKLETRKFSLVTGPPTEDEISRFKAIQLSVNSRRFPLDGGQMNYSKDKAYYTHFYIKGNKIAFILTPIGGLFGLGSGWNYGYYQICDFKTGERLSVGTYELPDDSRVFYRNDRMLTCLIDESGDYEIYETKLKGMD